MKKILLITLLVLSLLTQVGFADSAPEKLGPDALHAYLAFDFDSFDTGEVYKIGWQGVGKEASAMTVPDGNGGTAVMYTLQGKTAEADNTTVESDLWCYGGQNAKGFICRVKTQNDPVNIRFRFYAEVDGKTNRVSHGDGESLKLYNIETGEFICGTSKIPYTDGIEIPAKFDGYFIFEFRSFYVDTGQPLRPNSSDPHIHKNKVVTEFTSPLKYTLFLDGVAGATLMLDDFGYMTEYADVSNAVAPTDAPTNAPATVQPSAEATAPMQEAQDGGILEIVCIALSALSVVVIIACVVILSVKSKKKTEAVEKEAEETTEE